MRKFFIGDIRGDLGKLKTLLDKIGPVEGDSVIFLGSYLGPGKGSKQTVDYLLKIRKETPGIFKFLVGCYEFMFEEWLTAECNPRGQKTLECWQGMGGGQVALSYANGNGDLRTLSGIKIERIALQLIIPKEHLDFFSQELYLGYEDGLLPLVASHSGMPPEMISMGKDRLVFGSNGWWEDDSKKLPGGKEIVFSHIPFREPLVRAGKVGIDLGCGFGGKLCAFEAMSRKFYIV